MPDSKDEWGVRGAKGTLSPSLCDVPSSGSFRFSIGPNGHGRFALYLHWSGVGGAAMALVGQWPSIEKAERMAERIQQNLPQYVGVAAPALTGREQSP